MYGCGGSGFDRGSGQGSPGGSGIVILAVPTPNYSASYTGSNVVISTPPAAPGMTVLTYNSSGAYTA